MAKLVLRVRMVGGDSMDVIYEQSGPADEDEMTEHVISTLTADSGVLRTQHGDRLVVLYGRGVAAIQVSPPGAVL